MIYAIVNQKGGTGKTTTTANLGAALSLKGQRVLLMDLDPQASLTVALGVNDPAVTVYDVMLGRSTAQQAITRAGGCDLIPSSPDLAAVEIDLIEAGARQGERERIICDALAGLAYDFILIDCPPMLGLITLNALTAAQALIIPLQAEYLALDGLARLLDTVERVKRALNPALTVGAIVVTRYDQRRRLNRDVIEAIRASFEELLVNQPIRENIALAEAPSSGQHIFEYRPDSSGAADYAALADEIIRRATT